MKNLIEQSQFEVSNEENGNPAESELNTSCIDITSIKSNWCKVMSDDTWVIYEACLSAVASLTLKDNSNPLGLIIIGKSGNSKTTILNMFKDLPDEMTYYTDKFTPASFLTQAMNVRRENLETVDLIRRLPDKVFLVPDLAPLFGIKDEDLRQNLSTLTRVMDGQGLANDGGVHGHREFREECIFVLLGAVVKVRHTVWSVIADMGTRLLFIRMDDDNDEQVKEYLLRQLQSANLFQHNLEILKNDTGKFIESIFSVNGIRKSEWKFNEGEPEILITIIADLITSLRVDYDKELEEYEKLESPRRVVNQLYNLARGRAIIYGRDSLDITDIRLILRVALSSVIKARGQIVSSMLKSYPNTVMVQDLINSTSFKETKIGEEMKVLVEIGIAEKCKTGKADKWKISEKWTELHKILQ